MQIRLMLLVIAEVERGKIRILQTHLLNVQG